MKPIAIAVLLIASTASAADVVRTIGTRSYTLHSPPKVTAAAPLLLCFHALGQDPAGIARMTGFNALADRDQFHVAYPTGLNRSWNAGTCCNGNTSDDVGFAAAVVSDASRIASIDSRRVYATGFSNGAMLAHRIAAERPELLAAIAPVAGTLTTGRKPLKAVPVAMFHGTQDRLVSYTSAKQTERSWLYAGARVEFHAYVGLRHQWPPDASEKIVAFCKLGKKPG